MVGRSRDLGGRMVIFGMGVEVAVVVWAASVGLVVSGVGAVGSGETFCLFFGLDHTLDTLDLLSLVIRMRDK